MGTFGPGLYQSDYAADLRKAVSSVLGVPASADVLLGFLLDVAQFHSLGDDKRSTFWLVLADQFERRGLGSERVTCSAIEVIESGRDLNEFRERGADDRLLKKRADVLSELLVRLKSPRPKKDRRRPAKPPPMVLSRGEVYRFPTMLGRAWHPYRVESHGPFVPDGWGSLVVLDEGRAFDWIPWLAIAGLAVDEGCKPTIETLLNSRLIPHPQTNGVGRFIPKASHAKGLGLETLGAVDIDPKLVSPLLSNWPIHEVVECDWTIAYDALTRIAIQANAPERPRLIDLIKSAG